MITHKIADNVVTSSFSTLSGSDTEVGANEITIDSSFAAGSSNVALTLAFTAANLQSVFLKSDQACTLKTNGTSAGAADVQTITITGTPTGGDFAVQFGGQVTVIAYNATAATVQAALQAMSSIGTGNITCTGGPLPGTPVVCTFAGTKTPGLQALMTSFGNFTGGTTPAVAITHTTSGTPSNVINLVGGIPYIWRKSAGYNACLFTVDVTGAFVSCTPACRLQGKILTS